MDALFDSGYIIMSVITHIEVVEFQAPASYNILTLSVLDKLLKRLAKKYPFINVDLARLR